MSGYREEYTMEEDMFMLNFIIKNKAYNSIRGRKLWEDMAEEEETQRTWQSLKNRFIKKTVPNLHKYKIDVKEKEKFRIFFNMKSQSRINKPTRYSADSEQPTVDFIQEVIEEDLDEIKRRHDEEVRERLADSEKSRLEREEAERKKAEERKAFQDQPLCARCKCEIGLDD